MPILDDVRAAAARIEPHIHRTPVHTSERLNEIVGAELFFKCENLQKAGAFKTRGAVNTVFALDEAQLANGVATHSSGNHGAALARAARLRGIPAYIVVPEDARQVKKAAIQGYGAEVIQCEPTLQAREDTLAAVIARTGALEVHPYDEELIIAGQGTAALELVEQVDGLDAVVVPIGGGGLIAGTGLVLEGTDTRLYGAEPAGADDASRSLISGERVTTHVPDTICDGLLTVLGVRNFEIIQRTVSDVLLVEDDETIAAMSLIWTRMKLVTEPSSAIALAAVLKNPALFRGKRVAMMLTGGNVDLADLPF